VGGVAENCFFHGYDPIENGRFPVPNLDSPFLLLGREV